MIHLMRGLYVLFLVLAFLTGCQTLTGKSAGQNVDDAGITATVKAKLVADKASNLTRVDVDTTNGTVYLNGSVGDASTKVRAEQLAWQAKGVRGVVNNLQVSQSTK
jgi:hyperosmotically inducible protein